MVEKYFFYLQRPRKKTDPQLGKKKEGNRSVYGLKFDKETSDIKRDWIIRADIGGTINPRINECVM